LFGEPNFADFTGGTVSDNTIILSPTQIITPANEIPTVFLGGGHLHIRFSGEIIVYMGGYLNDAYHFTSDGTVSFDFTMFYENASPTFRVYAVQNTTVYEINYKASAM
jgi:hypothetical protein